MNMNMKISMMMKRNEMIETLLESKWKRHEVKWHEIEIEIETNMKYEINEWNGWMNGWMDEGWNEDRMTQKMKRGKATRTQHPVA